MRWLITFFFYGIGNIFLFVAVVYSYRNTLVKAVLEDLFQSKVTFQQWLIGDYRFPATITIHFYGVRVQGSYPSLKQPLFFIQKAHLNIDFWQWYEIPWRRTIAQCYLEDVSVYLFQDKQKRKNFQVFKKYDPLRPKPQEICLDTFVITRLQVVYDYPAQVRNYRFWGDSIGCRLKIFPHQLLFEHFNALGRVIALSEDNIPFLENRFFRLSTAFMIEKQRKIGYLLDSLQVFLEGVPIVVKGAMGLAALRLFQLNFHAEDAPLRTLLDILPENARKRFQPYAMGGVISLQGYLKGNKKPTLRLYYQCRDGFIIHKTLKRGIRNIRFHGFLSNGKQRSAKATFFTFDAIQAMVGKRWLVGSLKFYNLNRLRVRGQLKGRFEAAELLALLIPSLAHEAQGEISLKLFADEDLARLAQIKYLKNLAYDGAITFHNVQLYIPAYQLKVSQLDGNCFFTGNYLKAERLRFYLNQQLLHLRIYIQRPIAYYIGIEPLLRGQIELKGYDVNLDSLLFRLPIQQPKLPQKLHLNVDWDFRQLHYKQWHFTRVYGSGRIAPDTLILPAFHIEYPHLQLLQQLSIYQQQQLWQIHYQSTFINNDFLAFLQWFSPRMANQLKLLLQYPIMRTGAQLTVSGVVHWDSIPRFSFMGSLQNGYWITRSTTRLPQITRLRLQFVMNDSLWKRRQLTLENLHFYLDKTLLSGWIRFPDWQKDTIEWHLHGNIALKHFARYFPMFQHTAGKLNFSSYYKGKRTGLYNRKAFEQSQTWGRLQFEEVQIPRWEVSALTSTVLYDTTGIYIQHLKGKWQQHTITLQGFMPYLIAFLWNFPNVPLKGNFTLNIDSLVFKNAQKSFVSFALPEDNDVKIQCTINYFHSDRIALHSLKTILHLKGKRLYIAQGNCYFCQGTLTLRGSLDAEHLYAPRLFLQFHLRKVRLKCLLYTFYNFKQDFITDQNADGYLFTKGSLHHRFTTSGFDFYRSQLHLYWIKIEEGSLKDFLLLERFERFLPVSFPDTAYFDVLGRQWVLQRGKLQIPYLRFYSNWWDFFLTGYHTLKGNLFYRVVVLRATYRRKRSKPHVPAFPMRVFIIEGSTQHFRIRYDTQTGWKNFIRWFSFATG